jgi:hypothetical protein
MKLWQRLKHNNRLVRARDHRFRNSNQAILLAEYAQSWRSPFASIQLSSRAGHSFRAPRLYLR